MDHILACMRFKPAEHKKQTIKSQPQGNVVRILVG